MYIVYYLVSYTWGLLANFVGMLVALFLTLLGKKATKEYGRFVYRFGKNWGGLSLGNYIFISDTANISTRNHEIGHSIQNCIYGPFWLFLIGIPSAIRYWYREYLLRSGKKTYRELPDYDSIWFEGDATRRGTQYYDKMISKGVLR